MEIKAKYSDVAKLTSHAIDMIKNKEVNNTEFKDLIVKLVELSNNACNSDISDNFYFSPIHSAAQNGNLPLLHILFKNGANINAYNDHAITDNGRGTPAMVALKNGQIESFKFLAREGADLDVKGSMLISALQGYNIMILQTKDFENEGDTFEASTMKEFLYQEFRPVINLLYSKCSMLSSSQYSKTIKELSDICEIKLSAKTEEIER